MEPTQTTPMMTATTRLQLALEYAQRGWYVFPLAAGTKIPIQGTRGVHEATTNEQQIRKWWTAGDHNIGIACGPSGLLIADIDRDTNKGKHGDADLEDAEHTYGKLPHTPTVLTPSGGEHRYHNQPGEPVTVRNLGHIDIQRDGHYIVAAGSVTKAGRYEWESSAHIDDTPIVDLPPAWVTMLTKTHTAPERKQRTGGKSIFEAYNNATNFGQQLHHDGATIGPIMQGRARGNQPGGPYVTVTRPGKPDRKGHSARLWLGATDLLYVFSSAWGDGIQADKTYDAAEYWCATRHHGNKTAFRQWLVTQGYRAETIETEPTTTPHAAQENPVEPTDPAANDHAIGNTINWAEFWETDHKAEDWLITPIIPKNRSVSITAPAGTGKSLFALYVAAGLATGQHVLGTKTQPVRVLYVDYEMTESDLKERLEAMGYGPDNNLENLAYELNPFLDPLDTALGGQQLITAARKHQADLVIIDTIAGAVAGDENDADTYRALARHTGKPLKGHGIAILRIDHTGKDLEKGARGSSAKTADVDVAWIMTPKEGGMFGLRCTGPGGKTRVSWVPKTIEVTLDSEEDLQFILTPGSVRGYAEGTKACATRLDELGVPSDAGRRMASKVLKDHDYKVRAATVDDALRYRRSENDYTGHTSKTDPFGQTPDTHGTQTGHKPISAGHSPGHTTGHTGTQYHRRFGPQPSPPLGGEGDQAPPDTTQKENKTTSFAPNEIDPDNTNII